MAEHGLNLKGVTVPTYHMDRSVAFYKQMGFDLTYGDENSNFASVKIGNTAHINLVVRGMSCVPCSSRIPCRRLCVHARCGRTDTAIAC